RQHLVELNLVLLEAECDASQVQAPDARLGYANLRHRLRPVRVEIGRPGRAGTGVVLTKVLLVAYFEAGVMHERHEVSDTGEVAVGKHVAADEPAAADRVGVAGQGDAVVEQPAAWA